MSVHLAIAGMFLAFGLGIGLWGGASARFWRGPGSTRRPSGSSSLLYTGVYLVAMSSGGALSRRFGVRAHARRRPRSLTRRGALLAPQRRDARDGRRVCSSLVGFLAGVVDVTMNAEGARIERALGKSDTGAPPRAASSGIAIGADSRQPDLAGPAPWGAGLIAAAVLAVAGVAYDRAARSEAQASDDKPAARPSRRPRPAAASPSRRR